MVGLLSSSHHIFIMAGKKKIIRKLHLWMGLISGPIIFILGVTGCILAFEKEIQHLLDRENRIETNTQRFPLSQIGGNVQRYLGKKKQISSLEISADPQQAWRFRTFQEDENDGIWYWNEKSYYESVFVNPYSNKILGLENSEFSFFRVILYLHWSLLLKTSIGQPIVGIATLLYFLSLVSGLFLWWPKNKTTAKKRFAFKWKSTTGIRRKIYDLHSILGFYLVSIGVTLAFTGMVWAFPWLNKAIQSVLSEQGAKELSLPQNVAAKNPETADPLEELYCQVTRETSLAKGYAFYFPKSADNPHITTVAIFDKSHQSIVFTANKYTGKIVGRVSFSDKDSAQKFEDLNYDIHLGLILGIPGKIIVFIASLLSASLPVTGFLIWYKRKKKSKSNTKL